MANETCPHCGTEHDNHVVTVSPWRLHNLARCRDVIRGQRDEARAKVDEAERDLTDAQNEVCSQRPSWFRVRNILNGALLKIRDRAALEKLREK